MWAGVLLEFFNRKLANDLKSAFVEVESVAFSNR